MITITKRFSSIILNIKCFIFIIVVFQSNLLLAQTQSFKRGFSGNIEGMADLEAMDSISWYYNWHHAPISNVADILNDRIDFVPMTWGANYNKEELRHYLSNHPEIRYLLGFNEPNFIEQANIGPKAAAALWPDVQEITDEFDLELVSPALNFSYSGGAVIEDGTEYTDPIQYLDTFFVALPEGSRVDYVAIHGYFDNAGAWPWYVGLYDKYERPLWITEFNHSALEVTEISQQNFMVETIDYFEKEPKVFRYAWFLSRSSQTNTNLFVNGRPGGLTDLGLIFTQMSAYDSSFYHSTNEPIEAQHYVDMSGIHLIVHDDTSGTVAAHDFDEGDWVDYQIDVPTAGTYTANFRITSVWDSEMKIYQDNNLIGQMDLPVTGGLENWKTYGVNIELEAGKQTLRLLPGPGGFRLNWWSLDEPVTVTGLHELNFAFDVFPNPATEIITVSGMPKGTKRISICNLMGKKVKNLNTADKKITIDIEGLESGIYIINILSKGELLLKKITKT